MLESKHLLLTSPREVLVTKLSFRGVGGELRGVRRGGVGCEHSLRAFFVAVSRSLSWRSIFDEPRNVC